MSFIYFGLSTHLQENQEVNAVTVTSCIVVSQADGLIARIYILWR